MHDYDDLKEQIAERLRDAMRAELSSKRSRSDLA